MLGVPSQLNQKAKQEMQNLPMKTRYEQAFVSFLVGMSLEWISLRAESLARRNFFNFCVFRPFTGKFLPWKMSNSKFAEVSVAKYQKMFNSKKFFLEVFCSCRQNLFLMFWIIKCFMLRIPIQTDE